MAQPCANSSLITACVTCCPESFKNKYELIQWLNGRWWHKYYSRPVNWWSFLKPHTNSELAMVSNYYLIVKLTFPLALSKVCFLSWCHPLSSLGSTKPFVCSSSSFGIVISPKHPMRIYYMLPFSFYHISFIGNLWWICCHILFQKRL